MITSINEWKKSVNNKVNEGRGNHRFRHDGVNYPTYYIDYYSSEDEDEDGNPYFNEDANDYFVDDVVGNIKFSDFAKELNLIKLDKPKYLSNDEAIYFENDTMLVAFADNENSMAIGTIPKFTQNDESYEDEYNEVEFKRQSNKFFNGLLGFYGLRKATSAWTSAEVTSIDESSNNDYKVGDTLSIELNNGKTVNGKVEKLSPLKIRTDDNSAMVLPNGLIKNIKVNENNTFNVPTLLEIFVVIDKDGKCVGVWKDINDAKATQRRNVGSEIKPTNVDRKLWNSGKINTETCLNYVNLNESSNNDYNSFMEMAKEYVDKIKNEVATGGWYKSVGTFEKMQFMNKVKASTLTGPEKTKLNNYIDDLIANLDQSKKYNENGNIFGNDDEQLYHEIDWFEIEDSFKQWLNDNLNTPNGGYSNAFNYIKSEIEKYKMTN